MPARGRLIALEGIDGCGKSTQARALADALGARLTFEPGATPVGARLRQLLLAPDAPPPSPRAEALLMAADRAEHVARVLEPALAAGEWVVSDRYAGVDHRLPGLRAGPRPRRARRAGAWATGGLAADLSVLVDVSVEVAAARLAAAGRGGADRMERLGPGLRRPGCARGSWPRRRRTPEHWIVVDGEAEVARADGAYRGLRARTTRRRAGPGAGDGGPPRPRALRRRRVAGRGGGRAARRGGQPGARLPLPRARPATAASRRPTGSPPRCCAPTAGAAQCATCRAALAGTDPDLHVVRRSGASVSKETCARSSRWPSGVRCTRRAR